MVSKKVIVLSIVLSALVSFFFKSYFWLLDIPDYVVVKSIPIYPNVFTWRITSFNGFPTGSTGGYLNFETEDSTESVLKFYETELGKLGWELNESLSYENSSWRHFEKTIAGRRFGAYVSKVSPFYNLSTSGFVKISHRK